MTNMKPSRHEQATMTVLALVAAVVALVFGLLGLLVSSLLARSAPRSFAVALVLGAALLSAGCHTISAEALEELHVAAAQSQANVRDPALNLSELGREALWKQGRVFVDVLLDVMGEPIPTFYLVDPWAAPPVDLVPSLHPVRGGPIDPAAGK